IGEPAEKLSVSVAYRGTVPIGRIGIAEHMWNPPTGLDLFAVERRLLVAWFEVANLLLLPHHRSPFPARCVARRRGLQEGRSRVCSELDCAPGDLLEFAPDASVQIPIFEEPKIADVVDRELINASEHRGTARKAHRPPREKP